MKQVMVMFFLFTLLFLLGRNVFAQPSIPPLSESSSTSSAMREGERVVIPVHEVITRDFFGAGETVEILGTVNDDVYVAGGQVIIDGTVNGDVLAAGGNITISGTVTDDVRIAGGNIIISGSVGKNLTVVGGNVTITSGSRVAGNVVLGAGNVQVDGTVGGNITGGGGTVTIANTVAGDVHIGVGTLRIVQPGLIAGDLMYISEEEVTVPPGSVSGTVTRKSPEEMERLWPKNINREKVADTGRGWFVVELLAFLAALVLGSVIVLAAPHYASSMGCVVADRPWQSLGMGFMFLIVAPIACIIFLITIIGLPVGIIGLMLYGIALYVSKFPVALWIGQKIIPLKETKATLPQLAIGLLALYGVGMIPLLGMFTRFVTLVIGLGALLLAKYSLYTTLRGKKSL